MKHLLLTTIAAVVLVGCGPSDDILLHNAAEQGDLNAVRYYLKSGANKNVKHGPFNDTPLHRAIISQNEDIVIYLVNNGANINAEDALGTTALDDAYDWGNKRIIDLILLNGGKTGEDLGITSVSAATIRQNKNIWELDFMEYIPFLILSFGCPICALCNLIIFYKKRSVYALLKSSEVTPMRYLHPGFVEVSGRAESNEKYLISPWRKTECIYYNFHVEVEHSSGDNSSYWKTYLKDAEFVPFTVNDNTGRVKIDKTIIDFHLTLDDEFKSGIFKGPTAELKELLSTKYQQDTERSLLKGNIRVTEKTIHPDEMLYVFGNATKEKDGWLIGRKGDMPIIVSDSGEASVEKKFWNDKYVSFTLIIISILGTLIGLNWFFKYNMWVVGTLLLIYITTITSLVLFYSNFNKKTEIKTVSDFNNKDIEENDLFQLCQNIISNGELNTDSVRGLAEYINNSPDASETWPGNLLIEPLKKVWEDGVVNVEELKRLLKLLESIVQPVSSGHERPPSSANTAARRGKN